MFGTVDPQAILQALQSGAGQQPQGALPNQPLLHKAGDVIQFPGQSAQQQLNTQGIQRMDSTIADYYAKQQAAHKATLDAIIKGMMKPNLTLIPGGKK